MSTRRTAKLAAAVREVVGMSILTDLRDPRVQGVTVVSVEVAEDLRSAKVFVSIMGDEAKQRSCLYGLQRSAGFLQHKIAERIDTRYTPRLFFELDHGVKHSLEVARILREVLPTDATDSTGTNSAGTSGDEATPDELATDDVSTDEPNEESPP